MDLKSISSSCGYSVRKLGFGDIDIIFNVLKGNTLYYEYHPPFVTKESIIDDIKALPPGKNYSDKYFIGFFNEEKLYAVKAERVEPSTVLKRPLFAVTASKSLAMRQHCFVFFLVPTKIWHFKTASTQKALVFA